jgi:hypothetical protein
MTPPLEAHQAANVAKASDVEFVNRAIERFIAP